MAVPKKKTALRTSGKIKRTSGKKKPASKTSASPTPVAEKNTRLQVLLAKCGLGSRRACEELIVEGRVKIDGGIAELGARVSRDSHVTVDDEPIRPERKAYYMVNKPKGMLCTNNDPKGRLRVIDLFPKTAGRLFPVGRLDENTVGLLLVTNDGELSHQLAHPKFRVPKTYKVQVAGNPNHETIRQLKSGIYFSDGKFKVEGIKRVSQQGKSSVLEVTLNEGQNREVRRLFARVGHKVMKLERIAFGPLKLRNVANGKFRKLTRDEVKLLRNYIDNREQRIQEDIENKRRKKTKKRVQRKRATPKTVEISATENSRTHDITGRRRPRRK